MIAKLKRTAVAGLVALCLLMLLSFRAHASSGRIYFNDPTVTVGDSVTITMTLTGEQLGAADVVLTYDTTKLEYVSGSGSPGLAVNGGSGSVVISWYDTTATVATTVTCSMVFKTLSTGTAVIKPSYAEVVDIDDAGVSLTSYGSSTITINPEVTASTEARLSALSVNGTLSPGFSADTYSYTTSESNDVTRLVISLTTKDSNATYTISSTSLSVGKNTITILVTAEDGSTTKTYTITATRAAAATTTTDDTEDDTTDTTTTEDAVEETPEEEVVNPVYVSLNGEVLIVAQTLEGLTLPDTFEATTITLGDDEVAAAVSDIIPLTLVWLSDSDGETGAWYILDAENGTMTLYFTVTCAAERYIILDITDDSLIPDGFVNTTLTIDERELTVLYAELDGTETDFYLVYAINAATGEAGLYRYDALEGTLQRYVRETLEEEMQEEAVEAEPEIETEEEVPEDDTELLALQEELDALKAQREQERRLGWILLLVAVVIILLLMILLVVVTAAKKKSRGEKPESAPVEMRCAASAEIVAAAEPAAEGISEPVPMPVAAPVPTEESAEEIPVDPAIADAELDELEFNINLDLALGNFDLDDPN